MRYTIVDIIVYKLVCCNGLLRACNFELISARESKGTTMAEEEQEPPKNGCGTFYYKNGASYKGDWKILEPEPPPVVEEPKKGKAAPPPVPEENVVPPKKVRHGKGVYKEGDYLYDGEWSEDNMHGNGKFEFASNAWYDGAWVANNYEGEGQYQWPDGSCYKGEWHEGAMHGKGVYTDKAGHRWEGQFFNGSGPGLTCHL